MYIHVSVCMLYVCSYALTGCMSLSVVVVPQKCFTFAFWIFEEESLSCMRLG